MKPAQIHSEMIQYPGHKGTPINAYLSHPVAPGRYPGVIVIMEAFGLNDHIKDIARRFAAEGYVALAPDMYTREGSPDPSNINDVIKAGALTQAAICQGITSDCAKIGLQ